ncbi:hypothetical protein MUP56_00095, partial [Patescibacteria group bacterium]|nr:hypothetical protein [Patescibacteria group bacterium]
KSQKSLEIIQHDYASKQDYTWNGKKYTRLEIKRLELPDWSADEKITGDMLVFLTDDLTVFVPFVGRPDEMNPEEILAQTDVICRVYDEFFQALNNPSSESSIEIKGLGRRWGNE